jgi:hypothetical protein
MFSPWEWSDRADYLRDIRPKMAVEVISGSFYQMEALPRED